MKPERALVTLEHLHTLRGKQGIHMQPSIAIHRNPSQLSAP